MDPRKIILHIGHGKTGSSYLQSCLALNKSKLMEYGIDYPEHRSFGNAISGKISSGNGVDFLELLPCLNSDSESILFSYEGLHSTLLRSSEFLDMLASKKYTFKILLYTRNLFDHKFSSWGQAVKRGGCTKDVSDFFIEKPAGPYKYVLQWLKLMDKYEFDLIVRNYSNNKRSLAQRFFSDITELSNIELEFPEVTTVNRSLTSVELSFQRVLNRLELGSSRLSDYLVNSLPDVKPSKVKCNQEAYDLVVDANFNSIELINKYLDSRDIVEIEPSEDVTFSEFEANDRQLTDDQIDLIVNYFSARFIPLDGLEMDAIHAVAVNIANNSENLQDAMSLMKILQAKRPKNSSIKKLLSQWNEQIVGDF
ncbi:hypothetical protein N9996_02455 [Synechococcus sp. AH-603-M21]|nr:hypothetical protein [Synechococcus sp. AH-603-M21]